MAQLVFDFSSRGGLTDNYFGDMPYSSAQPQLSILGTDQQYADGQVNPFSKYGYLTPANITKRAFATASDNILSCSQLVTGFTGTPSTPAGIFGEYVSGNNNSKIYELTTPTALSFATSITASDATNYPKITDIEIYMLNGVRKVFASWTSPSLGSGNISVMGDDLSSPDHDWLSAAATSGFRLWSARHRLITADNSFMYVLDGFRVHKIDGTDVGSTNGIAYENVLKFLGSFDSSISQTTSIADGIMYRNSIWIALNITRGSLNDMLFDYNETNTYTDTMCGIYVWDKQTTTASSNNFVFISNARMIVAMVEAFNVPVIFTMGSDGNTELRMWNGSSFEIVKKLGKNAYPRWHDSISVSGNMLTWLGNDGILYAYGKIDSTGYSLHKIGDFSSNVATGKTYGSSGAILLMNGAETNTTGYNTYAPAYYVSYTDSDGTAYTSKFYPFSFEVATASQYASAGNYYSLVKFLPKLSQADRFTLFFPKTGSGGSTTVLTMNIYLNQSSTAFKTITLTQDDLARGYKNIEINKSNVNAIQIGFVWNTAIALKNTITPSHGIFEYTPTGKII